MCERLSLYRLSRFAYRYSTARLIMLARLPEPRVLADCNITSRDRLPWLARFALLENLSCVVKSLMLQLFCSQGSLSFATMRRYCFILNPLLISPYLVHGVPTAMPLSIQTDDTPLPYTCTDSPAWSGTSFNPRNCATAMSQFFVQELLVHGDAVFEFRAVGAQPRTRYPLEDTPIKFEHGEPVHVRSRLNSCPKRSGVHSQNKHLISERSFYRYMRDGDCHAGRFLPRRSPWHSIVKSVPSGGCGFL